MNNSVCGLLKSVGSCTADVLGYCVLGQKPQIIISPLIFPE